MCLDGVLLIHTVCLSDTFSRATGRCKENGLRSEHAPTAWQTSIDAPFMGHAGQLRSAGQRAQNAEHKRRRRQDTKAAQMNGNSILSLLNYVSGHRAIWTTIIMDNHATPESDRCRTRYCSLFWEQMNKLTSFPLPFQFRFSTQKQHKQKNAARDRVVVSSSSAILICRVKLLTVKVDSYQPSRRKVYLKCIC